MTARGIMPAPMTIPAANDQNRNTISIGSLIAARNLTIDNAPTIPSERTTLLVTAMITRVVTSDRPINDIANPVEYMIPLKVFLYTTKMKRPTISANTIAMSVSSAENSLMLSRKLDLNTSLNDI